MRAAAAFLIGIILGAGGLAVLLGDRLRDGSPPSPTSSPIASLPTSTTTTTTMPAMCDGLVRLSLRGGNTVEATPDRVCVAVGKTVTWEIVDRGIVTLDFEEDGAKKGPFPETGIGSGNIINKDRGIYILTHDGSVGPSLNVTSRQAEELPRPWKYTVKWKVGDQTFEKDPVICIRK